jgi:hypothetical protein
MARFYHCAAPEGYSLSPSTAALDARWAYTGFPAIAHILDAIVCHDCKET